MRIENNIYNHYNNFNQQRTNNNTSFGGLGIKNLHNISPKKILFPVNQDKYWDECSLMAGKIGIQTRKMASLLEYKPEKRVSLMRNLVESYNARNFAFEHRLKEDPTPLINIFQKIDKPESAHFNIIEKSNMPFKSLEEVFTAAKTKEDLGFVQDMQHDILDGTKESAKIIVEMLTSPQHETFVKNPQKFKSYLKLFSKQPNCTEELEKLVHDGKYNRQEFDNKLLFENMMKQRQINSTVGKFRSFIEQKLNNNNARFLKHFCNDFLAFRKGLSEEDKADILRMYSTTNEKNLKNRLRIIEKFRHTYSDAQTGISDIRAMKNLFAHIDSNPHKAAFVEKALNNNIKVETMEDFNTILSTVPPKKAEIFYKNIVRIVRYTNPEERKSALITEIENPFFPIKRVDEKRKREVITFSNLQKDSKFEKFSKFIENKINIMKYKKVENDAPQAFIPDEGENIFVLPKNYIHIPQVSTTIALPAVTDKKSKISLIRMLKSLPTARKLKVKSDINEVIKNKLGQKTYESQSRDYGIKATSIRLKLLPEIFDSISATRKAQRAAGQRPNVENRDALMLYEKITGRNRKLVRYMLKKTYPNTDERMFDINDIIKLIDEAEAKIAKDKKANPQYRAADAKAYYEQLFQNHIAIYGKLKRTQKAA